MRYKICKNLSFLETKQHLQAVIRDLCRSIWKTVSAAITETKAYVQLCCPGFFAELCFAYTDRQTAADSRKGEKQRASRFLPLMAWWLSSISLPSQGQGILLLGGTGPEDHGEVLFHSHQWTRTTYQLCLFGKRLPPLSSSEWQYKTVESKKSC